MSIKKQFLKGKPVCKVTFKIPKSVSKEFSTAHVVGTFNNWELTHPMNKLTDGSFSAVLELEKGGEYHFRYVLDNVNWLNDESADGFVPTEFHDAENSLLRCIEE